MAISPTVSPCRIVPSHFSRPRGSVRKESSSPSTTIQNSVTSSPADASVSPATNGRMRSSPAMAASCSESKPSQNRTVLNQATTRSASAVKGGIWNLRKDVGARASVYRSGIKVTRCDWSCQNNTPRAVRCRSNWKNNSNRYSGGGSHLQHNTLRASLHGTSPVRLTWYLADSSAELGRHELLIITSGFSAGALTAG